MSNGHAIQQPDITYAHMQYKLDQQAQNLFNNVWFYMYLRQGCKYNYLKLWVSGVSHYSVHITTRIIGAYT